MRLTSCLALAALTASAAAMGCRSGPRLGGLNPFYRAERTTFLTAAKRIDEIRGQADRSSGKDTPDQQAIVQSLVGSLAKEPDPLVRQAVLETTAEFRTPLAAKALLAGLSDTDANVRSASCRLLAQRREPAAAEALAAVVQKDEVFDVRIAAARALGEVGARKEQLLPVLEDPDPAMQLVGVEAMRRLTGENFGGDVAAYRALARGETPPARETSVASRVQDWLPFY